jgi:hypothetical protein
VRIRALLLAAIGALLLLAVSACSAPPPVPRRQPDQVEQAAIASAQRAAQGDGITLADDIWTQLWTPTQAGTRIARCIHQGSDGLLVFHPAPLADNAGGLSYTVILVPKSTTVDGGVGPPFFDGPTAQRLIDSCVAQYPVDFRLFSVPASDRARLYAYDLTVLRRCLLAHGQSVAPLPSRQRFEDLLRRNAPWNAYEQVRVADRAEWYSLADACPALPPAIAGDVAAVTTSATTP